MKMTKKKALIAVFAVAVIAMAGVGYAAVVNYTATATTSDDTISATYAQIKGSGTYTIYTGKDIKIYYDTSSSDGTVFNFKYRGIDEYYLGFYIDPTNDEDATYTVAITDTSITTLPIGLTASWGIYTYEDGTYTAYDGQLSSGPNHVYYVGMVINEDAGTSITNVTNSITINGFTLTATKYAAA